MDGWVLVISAKQWIGRIMMMTMMTVMTMCGDDDDGWVQDRQDGWLDGR